MDVILFSTVLIWLASSQSFGTKTHCKYKTSVAAAGSNDFNSYKTLSYKSGIIIDVLKDHCIDIILTNISPAFIFCHKSPLDGGHTIPDIYSSGTNTLIQISKITDAMSTKWTCSILDRERPPVEWFFELKVKGSKRLIMKINNKTILFKMTDLSKPDYDGVAVYKYKENTQINVECTNLDTDIRTPLTLRIFNQSGSTINRLSYGSLEWNGLFTTYFNNSYVDCIINNENLKQTFKYRTIFRLIENKVFARIEINNTDTTLKRTKSNLEEEIYEDVIMYEEETPVIIMYNIVHDKCSTMTLRLHLESDYVMREIEDNCAKKSMKVIWWLTTEYNNAYIDFTKYSKILSKLVTHRIVFRLREKVHDHSPMTGLTVYKNGKELPSKLLKLDTDSVMGYDYKVDYGKTVSITCVKSYKELTDNLVLEVYVNDTTRMNNEQLKYNTNTFSEKSVNITLNEEQMKLADVKCYLENVMLRMIIIRISAPVKSQNETITPKHTNEQVDQKRYNNNTKRVNEEQLHEIDQNFTHEAPDNESLQLHSGSTDSKENLLKIETAKVDTDEDGNGDLIIGSIAGVIGIIFVAGFIFFCYRKKKVNIPKNDVSELTFEDEYDTPEASNYPDNSFQYDYVYTKSNDSILTRPLPIPTRSKAVFRQDRLSTTDSESNYYCEIDEYFINKRNAMKQQKNQNIAKH